MNEVPIKVIVAFNARSSSIRTVLTKPKIR